MVFYNIISFLLDVVTGLLGGACLLRLYMQHQRIPFGNPLGRFVFALTNWLVLPLRRLIPAVGRWDVASLVAVFLLELAQFTLLWLLAGGRGGPFTLLLLAIFGVLRLAISTMTAMVIVYAIMSWVQNDSPLAMVIDRLCAPMLRPFRKLIPLVGGVDLSPLALLVVLQIGAILLGSIQIALVR